MSIQHQCPKCGESEGYREFATNYYCFRASCGHTQSKTDHEVAHTAVYISDRKSAGLVAEILWENGLVPEDKSQYLSNKGLSDYLLNSDVDFFSLHSDSLPSLHELASLGENLEEDDAKVYNEARQRCNQWKHQLLALYRDVDGNPTTVQAFLSSKKMYLSGTKGERGSWFTVNGETDTVYIAEGIATALSIHKMTGKTVLAVGELGGIAKSMPFILEKYGRQEVIVVADNDYKVGKTNNPGVDNAIKLSRTYGTPYIQPDCFVDPLTGAQTKADFDDVRSQLWENGQSVENMLKPLGSEGLYEPYRGFSKDERVDLSLAVWAMGNTVEDFFEQSQQEYRSELQTFTVEGAGERTKMRKKYPVWLLDLECATGKTSAVMDSISKTDSNVAVFVDNLSLADEFAGKMSKDFGVDVNVIRGLKEDICLEPNVIKLLQQETKDCSIIASAICSACPNVACQMNNQYKDVDTRVRVYQKQFMLQLNTRDEGWEADYIVVDENPDSVMLDEEVLVKTLTKSQMENEVIKNIATNLPEGVYGESNFDQVIGSVNIMEEVYELAAHYQKMWTDWEQSVEDWKIQVRENGSTISYIRRNPCEDAPSGPKGLMLLSDALFSREVKGENFMYVNKTTIEVYTQPSKLNKKWQETPILCLDGGGKPDLYSRMFRTYCIYDSSRINYPSNVNITQICDNSFGAKKLSNTVEPLEIFLKKKAEATDGVFALITTKDMETNLNLSDEYNVIHYGMERGTNSVEGATDLTVAGRFHPPSVSLLKKARCLFRFGDSAIVGEWGNHRVALHTPTGEYFYHKEYIPCEEPLREIYSCIVRKSIYQAVGRARAIRRTDNVEILILTNLACGLEVDRIITTDELGLTALDSGTSKARIDTGTVALTTAAKVSRVEDYLDMNGVLRLQPKAIRDAMKWTDKQVKGFVGHLSELPTVDVKDVKGNKQTYLRTNHLTDEAAIAHINNKTK